MSAFSKSFPLNLFSIITESSEIRLENYLQSQRSEGSKVRTTPLLISKTNEQVAQSNEGKK